MSMRTILHVGCGAPGSKLPRDYAAYKETRLDVNPANEPDVVASVVAMPMVESASFDAAFCHHVLEHLYAHEVSMALMELHRVLKPGGLIQINVPDLQAIGGFLALDQAHLPQYQAPIGQVCAIDMLYGYQKTVAIDVHMAHHTGFTKTIMKTALVRAGFAELEFSSPNKFELQVIAYKPTESPDSVIEPEFAEVA